MKKGFTLIELMIVIAIVAILMALIIPACSGNRQSQSVEYYTQCFNEDNKVFSEITDGKARYAGDGYYKVDGEIIYADFCDSERRLVDTVGSSPVVVD